jgi:hypothetical protein
MADWFAQNAPKTDWFTANAPVVGAEAKAQADATARNGKPDDEAQHGFFHTLWDRNIKPAMDSLADAYKKGDLGASQVSAMMSEFMDQAAEQLRSGGDIKKLPVIGTGATVTAQRMQDKVNAGNYTGAAAEPVSFLAPFAAVKLGGPVADAADSVAAAKDAIIASAAKNANLLKLGVKLAAKSSGVPGEVIGVLGKAANAASKDGAAASETAPGVRTPLSAEDAARQRNILEGRKADLAYSDFPQDMQQPAPAFTPTPAAALPSGRIPGRPVPQPAPPAPAPRVPLWQRTQAAPPAAEPAYEPVPATALPSGRVPGKPAAPPDPGALTSADRAFLEARLAKAQAEGNRGGVEFYTKKIEALPAPAPPPVVETPPTPTPVTPPTPAPAPTLEQQLQDSVDAVKARKAAAAEAVTQANRTKAADRWRDALRSADMKAPALDDDAAWKRLAVNMGERPGYVPSMDTRQLIHERMGQAPDAAETALRGRLKDMLAPETSAPGDAAVNADAAPPQFTNPRRPITAMAAPRQLPDASWITDKGKVETLNRGAGETHITALKRLKQTGDALTNPIENGWIRQTGDFVEVHDVSNPNLATAFHQAAQTPEAAKSGAVVVFHKAGPPIEVDLPRQGDFLRNPRKWVRPKPGAR